MANPNHEYLEEENEKVDYFTRQRSFKSEILSVKVYPGAQGKETRRYFFENFPMFLSQRSGTPLVNFIYIEDDIRSIQTFASFVERCRALFEVLGNGFKLIFVSNSAQSFPLAHIAFIKSLSPAARERDHQQLARFVWLKKIAEERRFKELAHKDVIEWQRGVKCYSDTSHETQYQTWKETGSCRN